MILSAAQCRAARGLLGWSQQKLANNSGIAVNTIINFERGHSQARVDTCYALEKLFARHGVVLQAPCGVALQEGQAHVVPPHQVPSFAQAPVFLGPDGAVWVQVAQTGYWVVATHNGLAQLVKAASLQGAITQAESP